MVDISIIIPTFRRPGPLREAIESVLNQSVQNFEMLVIDDSPEGSARPVVEAIGDSRIRYQKMAVPSGGKPALVRNSGIESITGRFVHFLDDDDRVADGAYADWIKSFEQHPNAGVVFGIVVPFGEDAKALAHERAFFSDAARRARLFRHLGNRRMFAANQLFKNTMLVCSACMIRRECLIATDGFESQCVPVEDVAFYLRMIRRFGGFFLDRPVIHYRTGTPSLMHSLKDNTPLLRAFAHMYARYKAEYGSFEFFALKVLMRTVFYSL